MGSIWAITTNTIKQALRMKIAVAFIVLLVVLLGAMAMIMTGDGTLKGRIQSFVAYGLGLENLLLCLLTIVVAVYSLTSDIKGKQIYTVATKPIQRSWLIIGKLLGTVLLSVGLLILFSTSIYLVTIYMPKFFPSDKEELTRLSNEFYTARASLKPAEADVTEEVLREYDRLKRTGQLEQFFKGVSRKKIIAQLTNIKRLEKRSVGPARDLIWEFNNIKLFEPNESLFVRFKYDVSVNPPDLQVFGRWEIGDLRQLETGKVETPIYVVDRKDLIRTFHEIEVPADAVAKDGFLAVRFLNVPLNDTVVIFQPEALEVLYKADSFTANFIRAVILILLRLIFLACLGVLASTFLSFPVAILASLTVFFSATISNFCLESFDFLTGDLSDLYSYTLRPIIRLLPQFDKFNPGEFLIEGRLISWSLVGHVALFMVCIKAALLLFLALLIFRYKELARVVVYS